jgi:hypothetical protein
LFGQHSTRNSAYPAIRPGCTGELRCHGSTKSAIQNNAVLKRDGGFAIQDAAKKIKLSRQPDSPDIERLIVGQNAEKPTRQRLALAD